MFIAQGNNSAVPSALQKIFGKCRAQLKSVECDVRLEIRSSSPLGGLSALYSRRVDLTHTSLVRFGNQIAVTASVYALLSFGKETAGGSRSLAHGADVINAAVLGVMLADVLWDKIFDHAQRDTDSWEGLAVHLRCLRRQSGGVVDTELKYPILSLSAAVRAFATPSWHDRAPVFGYHSLSASQVFFILFFVHHVCLPRSSYGSGVRASAQMRGFDEFFKAFDCAGTPIRNSVDACGRPG